MKQPKLLLLMLAAFLSIPCATSALALPQDSISVTPLPFITPSKISACNTGLTTGYTDIHTSFWDNQLKLEMPTKRQMKESQGLIYP
jgi:hypothetical protein